MKDVTVNEIHVSVCEGGFPVWVSLSGKRLSATLSHTEAILLGRALIEAGEDAKRQENKMREGMHA